MIPPILSYLYGYYKPKNMYCQSEISNMKVQQYSGDCLKPKEKRSSNLEHVVTVLAVIQSRIEWFGLAGFGDPAGGAIETLSRF